MENSYINKLKNEFKFLVGSAHLYFGCIESDLKQIAILSLMNENLLSESKIKDINRKGLGSIKNYVLKLNVVDKNILKTLEKSLIPYRNYLTHDVQDKFYDLMSLSKKENDKRLLQNLKVEVKKLHDLILKIKKMSDIIIKVRLKMQKDIK